MAFPMHTEGIHQGQPIKQTIVYYPSSLLIPVTQIESSDHRLSMVSLASNMPVEVPAQYELLFISGRICDML